MSPGVRRTRCAAPPDPRSRPLRACAIGAVALAFAACAAPPPADEPPVATDAPLVVWSAFDEATLGPLVEDFRRTLATDAPPPEVEVRYGAGRDFAADLGAVPGAGGTGAEAADDAPPAPDLLLADALTLGTLADAGRLRPLSAELIATVPANFADADGGWVGLTGRARVVVYDPGAIAPEALPRSLSAVGEPRYRGRFALAPGDPSFTAHLTVYRALNGAQAFAELLARWAANRPLTVAADDAVVTAVAAGEVPWGLTGSDALCRHRGGVAAEQQAADRDGAPSAAQTAGAEGETTPPPLAAFHMPTGDGSGFVGVSGGGVLSAHPSAVALLGHLLSAETQARLVAATCSYPLVTGAEPPPGQPPLADLDAPHIDFGEVARVYRATREAIAASGLGR